MRPVKVANTLALTERRLTISRRPGHNRRGFASFFSQPAGHRIGMLENLVKGAMAGLAGISALNAAGYGDMVLQGRAASSTPARVVEELAKRSGRTIPGNTEQRQNRAQAMGALAGIATGAAVGAAAGQLHAEIRGLGPVLGPVLVGGAAMAATDLGMFGLGVSDPRSWDWTSWLSDAIPHLAYGVVTWALLPR